MVACTAAALLHHPGTSNAQPPCDREALVAAAATLAPGDLRLPPHGQRSRRCLHVGDGAVALGTPAPVSLPGAPCVIAVTFRRTVMLNETCGYDVHNEPLEFTGVALRRAGSRWRTITATHLPMRDLAALTVSEDGRSMQLEGRSLRLRGGRLVLRAQAATP